MTQEEKSLLLKDLCARLPYKCVYSASRGITHWNKLILNIDTITKLINNEYDDIKPYLRPMSSMTEEEVEEFRLDFHYHFYIGHEYSLNNKDGSYMMPMFVMRDYFDWLNKHHFDYRGLIEKGLALEAPEGMYK